MRKKIPNMLTAFRLAILPATLGFLAMNTWWGNIVSCVLFVVASVTDYWDGYLARRWRVTTTFGKFFDPLADKLLVIGCLIMLQAIDRVNPWVVILVTSREIFVTGLRALAIADGVHIASSNEGKWKTGLQMTAIGFLMMSETLYWLIERWTTWAFNPPWFLRIETIGSAILLASVALSLWSALVYYLHFLKNEKSNNR